MTPPTPMMTEVQRLKAEQYRWRRAVHDHYRTFLPDSEEFDTDAIAAGAIARPFAAEPKCRFVHVAKPGQQGFVTIASFENGTTRPYPWLHVSVSFFRVKARPAGVPDFYWHQGAAASPDHLARVQVQQLKIESPNPYIIVADAIAPNADFELLCVTDHGVAHLITPRCPAVEKAIRLPLPEGIPE